MRGELPVIAQSLVDDPAASDVGAWVLAQVAAVAQPVR
jgi:urease accessory protein